MNVIFLDFDGTLDTFHYHSEEDIENKIKILSDICKELDCKVVIESSAKRNIDEETLEVNDEDEALNWLRKILENFKKYGIECIGRTPCIGRRLNKYSYTPIWKEDEIRVFLFRHPEIDHYVIIDDDDLWPRNSDLDTVRNHLVTTLYYSENPEEEGLLEKHKEEIRKKLELENEIKKFAEKRKSISH